MYRIVAIGQLNKCAVVHACTYNLSPSQGYDSHAQGPWEWLYWIEGFSVHIDARQSVRSEILRIKLSEFTHRLSPAQLATAANMMLPFTEACRLEEIHRIYENISLINLLVKRDFRLLGLIKEIFENFLKTATSTTADPKLLFFLRIEPSFCLLQGMRVFLLKLQNVYEKSDHNKNLEKLMILRIMELFLLHFIQEDFRRSMHNRLFIENWVISAIKVIAIMLTAKSNILEILVMLDNFIAKQDNVTISKPLIFLLKFLERKTKIQQLTNTNLPRQDNFSDFIIAQRWDMPLQHPRADHSEPAQVPLELFICICNAVMDTDKLSKDWHSLLKAFFANEHQLSLKNDLSTISARFQKNCVASIEEYILGPFAQLLDAEGKLPALRAIIHQMKRSSHSTTIQLRTWLRLFLDICIIPSRSQEQSATVIDLDFVYQPQEVFTEFPELFDAATRVKSRLTLDEQKNIQGFIADRNIGELFIWFRKTHCTSSFFSASQIAWLSSCLDPQEHTNLLPKLTLCATRQNLADCIEPLDYLLQSISSHKEWFDEPSFASWRVFFAEGLGSLCYDMKKFMLFVISQYFLGEHAQP